MRFQMRSSNEGLDSRLDRSRAVFLSSPTVGTKMIDIRSASSTIIARRKSIVMNAESDRVITRLYLPGSEDQIRNVVQRVMRLDESEALTILEDTLDGFSHRHRRFRETRNRTLPALPSMFRRLTECQENSVL